MMRSRSLTNDEGSSRKRRSKTTEKVVQDEGAVTVDPACEVTFTELLEAGTPPSCSISVDNDDCVDTLCFEGVEWGVVTVAIERLRARKGRITGAVVNQTHRRLFIQGPGLPQWGVALQLLRSGFRNAMYRLEDTFRKSGVPFNPSIHSIPGFDLPISALLKRKIKPLLELPRCPLSTDSILALIKKYAEARVDTSPAQLRTYRDHLKKEGLGIDNDGRQWFTNDGRKGPVPWVDIEAEQTPSSVILSDPPFFAVKKIDHLGDLSEPLVPGQRATKKKKAARDHRSGSPRVSGGTPTPSETDAAARSPSLQQKRSMTPHADHRVVSTSPRKARHVSSSPSRADNSMSSLTGASSVGSAKRSKSEHQHNIHDVSEDTDAKHPACLVAPCVIHIPKGQVVTVDQEVGLKV